MRRTIEQNYYFTQILVISEHNGSHVDAPVHIHRGAAASISSPAAHLIGPYKKYDLIGLNPEAGKNISLAQIKEVEARDRLSPEPGDIVLFQFDWDKHYVPDSKVLFEKDWYAANVPGITEEAMKHFVDRRHQGDRVRCGFHGHGLHGIEDRGMPGREKYFLPNNILPMSGFVKMGRAPAMGLFMAIPLKIERIRLAHQAVLVDTKKRPDILQSLAALKPHDIGTLFETNMPGFFNHPTLGIVPDARTYEKHGHYMQTLVLCEHNGSHTDSFKHIHENTGEHGADPCNFLIGPYKKITTSPSRPQSIHQYHPGAGQGSGGQRRHRTGSRRHNPSAVWLGQALQAGEQ